MKITKKQLRKIIREAVQMLKAQDPVDTFDKVVILILISVSFFEPASNFADDLVLADRSLHEDGFLFELVF